MRIAAYTGLIQGSDGDFYGATGYGGSYGAGTVFKIDASGNFSVLHSFDGSDSSGPSGLIQGSDGSFYGTTSGGGSANSGTIFKLDPTGNFSILYSFDYTSESGANPFGLIQGSDGLFYGFTNFYGDDDALAVFKFDASSGHFSVLHSFDKISGSGGMIQGSDGSFYGITAGATYVETGMVFKLDPSGSFSVIRSFDKIYGVNPYSGLIQSKDGNFYGTTNSGGIYSHGTIFKLDLAGNFSVLHSFDGSNNDGGWPYAGLIQAGDGSFYGTTFLGGQYDGGVIYRLVEPPDAAPIALESSANPSLRGQRVTFTATVTGSSPTGSVRFLKGTKNLGSVPLIGGVARLSTSRLKIGSHSVTAVYSGDADYASVTSATLVQVVKAVKKKEPRARPRGNWGRGNR